MPKAQNVVLEPEILTIIRQKLEMEWPGESIYLFDSKAQPNNDGWRYIELWSRRRSSTSGEAFRCIVCELNHSHTLCPGCHMPATID